MSIAISIISLFISLFAMLFNGFNTYRNWNRQRFRIRYEMKKVYFVENVGFYVKFLIINDSSEPITITGIKVNDKIADSRNLTITDGTKTKPSLETKAIPFEIGSFGAEEFYTYFYRNNENFSKGFVVELRTSRGVTTNHFKKRDNNFIEPIVKLLKY